MTTLITPTLTYAIKCQKILKRIGVTSNVVKLDADGAKNGCQYGVSIKDSDVLSAIYELKENGIPYSVKTNDLL